MKKMKWIIIVAILLLVALFGLKKAGVIGTEEGLRVAVDSVEHRTIIETVNASGKIFPEIEVKVSPDVSGEIVKLEVEEGDSVRKNQVLVSIYADIYTTQRDQAAAVVAQQEAMVNNSKAQVESLKSALDFAKRTFDRQKQLLEQKVISAAEFEQAQNGYQSAKANYDAAIQTIRSGEAAVSSARASLERANKDLSRTVVLSPMDGVVSLSNVKEGERVVGNSMMAGTEMMRIADMSTLEIRVDVGENDIPKVKYNDSVLIEVDAYPNRKFRGVVTKIASSSNSAAAQAGVTSNDVTNYKVHIRLIQESYKDLLVSTTGRRMFPFRPGMTASVDIQTKIKKDVIAVPINAVTTREKDSDKPAGEDKELDQEGGAPLTELKTISSDLDEVVFILQPDGRVKKVLVKTDIQDINYIEVTSGLKGGEKVVTAPYNVVSKVLKDGSAVLVTEKDKLFEAKK